MAKMIPDYVHQDCKSRAERKLFNRFRDELSDDYIVLHSLGLAKHQKKLSSEIDFLIISSRGFLCVEIKGGAVERNRGRWFFTDRYGEVHSKKESPFEQSRSAMYALRRSIEGKFGKSSAYLHCVSGYFVIFPDVEFTLESPEWDLNRLIESGNITKSFSVLAEQQYSYSENEIKRVTGKFSCSLLNKYDIAQLVQFLRGDFNFIPSLSTVIEDSYSELLKLTEEQYVILDQLAENQRVFVHGRAGTGKTVLALEKARRSAQEGKQVLYVCFNRLLAKKIRQIVKNEVLSDFIEVYTLHAYARKVIEAVKLTESLKGYESDDLYRKRYPEVFMEALLVDKRMTQFDILVVDEGQDLRHKVYIEMLDMILKNGFAAGEWLWMEDDQQNLFNRGNNKNDVDLSQYNSVFCRLTRNCRNTKPISIFNALASGTEIEKCLSIEGASVETVFYRDNKHQLREIENMVHRLLSGGVSPWDIVLLTSVSHEKSVLEDLEKISGLSIIPYENHSFNRKNIGYSTIHSFKGLESKAIIITDIEDVSSDTARCLNYVGFSRAMSWLGVMIHEKVRSQYEDLAREFGSQLVQQRKKNKNAEN